MRACIISGLLGWPQVVEFQGFDVVPHHAVVDKWRVVGLPVLAVLVLGKHCRQGDAVWASENLSVEGSNAEHFPAFLVPVELWSAIMPS